MRLSVLAATFLAAVACDEGRAVKLNPSFIAPSTDVVDFGVHEVGTETVLSLYLINKGDATLTLGSPEGDTLNGAFAVVLTKTAIPGLEDSSVKVAFTPAEARDYTTTFTFPNDSQNQPELRIQFKGTGVAPDPCKSLTCNTPPRAACVSSTTSRHYDPVGTCAEGRCAYAPLDETCGAFGCDEATGLCAKDPCVGVPCNTPPNPCFLAQGLCTNGSCRYTANNGAACHDSDPCTFNDTCAEGSCVGTRVTCNTPPPAACVDGTTLRQYQAVGACNAAGDCVYASSDTACQFGCANAACSGDPCAGGCDDGNPCTQDSCTPGGCRHVNVDGTSCIAGSTACPTGRCTAGTCLSVPDVTCQKEYDLDLCATTYVAGQCTAAGECVVRTPPPENRCTSCQSNTNPLGFCLKCTPIPGFGLEICL